jgi:pullulanase
MNKNLNVSKTNPNISGDIFELRKTNFVLWRPGETDSKLKLPAIYIAKVDYDYSKGEFTVKEVLKDKELIKHEKFNDLWLLSAEECNLEEGNVYHYWFKVKNTNSYLNEYNADIVYATDPFACVVDDRVQAKNLPIKEKDQTHYAPAGVIKYKKTSTGFELVPTDPDANEPDWNGFSTNQVLDNLKPNNELVIYELPPCWSYVTDLKTANGSFRQVEKMIDWSDNHTHLDDLFNGMDELNFHGKKYITYLGVNALELTPPANSIYGNDHQWGYGTANYFAPNYSLSERATSDNPQKNEEISPKPATDFVNLVKKCHKNGIRYFYDGVFAFSKLNSYRYINFKEFYLETHCHFDNDKNRCELHPKEPIDPNDTKELVTLGPKRDPFGGDLLRYKTNPVQGYNPNTGKPDNIYPAREYVIASLKEWIENKGVSGLRLDSVVNYDCYELMQNINEKTRTFFNTINQNTDSNKKYLVVGEELGVPRAILDQKRLDGLWNENFKRIVRNVIIGSGWNGETFEWSVKKMIDCTKLNSGFTDTAQSINYITSHDVGDYFNNRIYSYLEKKNIITEPRIKLAFACLMTAVGIPMILAGEEFGDEQDLFEDNVKQIDPVNYERLKYYDWRRRIFKQVVRLIKLRTTSKALSCNDVDFIYHNFDYGRVMVWKRGQGENIVVTIANFSDWGQDPYKDEYIIHTWPKTPPNKKWVEVTQGRVVNDKIGREPVCPWEAKVYELVNENDADARANMYANL